jgi:hypothetical protein
LRALATPVAAPVQQPAREAFLSLCTGEGKNSSESMLSVGVGPQRRPEIRTINLSMLLIGNRLGNLRLQNTPQLRFAGNRTNVAAESR